MLFEPAIQTFVKTPNVAQYKGANWDNLVKKESMCSLEKAQKIALSDPNISFFFLVQSAMFLEGKSGLDGWTEKGKFQPGDAVFFKGEPWYGSAPQCDAYQKRKTISVCYLETNTNDFDNVEKYVLEGGSLLFDLCILFAANINGTNDAPELSWNKTSKQKLDTAFHNGTLKRLQDKGMKISFCILGNHTEASIHSLTNKGVESFANQVNDVINKYKLDGIDFDDEWSASDTLSHSSFPLLVSNLRKRMPEKILSLYYIGGVTETLVYKDINVGKLLNYAWNSDYGSFTPPIIPPMSHKQLGPAAINMTQSDSSSAKTNSQIAVELANSTVKEGYGVYIYYNLVNKDLHDYLSKVSSVLYGQKTTYQG